VGWDEWEPSISWCPVKWPFTSRALWCWRKSLPHRGCCSCDHHGNGLNGAGTLVLRAQLWELPPLLFAFKPDDSLLTAKCKPFSWMWDLAGGGQADGKGRRVVEPLWIHKEMLSQKVCIFGTHLVCQALCYACGFILPDPHNNCVIGCPRSLIREARKLRLMSATNKLSCLIPKSVLWVPDGHGSEMQVKCIVGCSGQND
jgi:hypothetical protein